jgi:NAD-dependent deacetylase
MTRVVILSGSGLSAESGLPTFRDAAGLWRQHSWQELASPEGWRRRPELVLEFYNERRAKAWAIASLERKFDVAVVTQNVDALHERAGSKSVRHLHGELAWVRGTSPSRHRYHVADAPISLGHVCEDGTQLRPDIVWFGEETHQMDEAREFVAAADKVLVVGTSLSVHPAAGLVDCARPGAEKLVVALELEATPSGFEFVRDKATVAVPAIVDRWLG